MKCCGVYGVRKRFSFGQEVIFSYVLKDRQDLGWTGKRQIFWQEKGTEMQGTHEVILFPSLGYANTRTAADEDAKVVPGATLNSFMELLKTFDQNHGIRIIHQTLERVEGQAQTWQSFGRRVRFVAIELLLKEGL